MARLLPLLTPLRFPPRLGPAQLALSAKHGIAEEPWLRLEWRLEAEREQNPASQASNMESSAKGVTLRLSTSLKKHSPPALRGAVLSKRTPGPQRMFIVCAPG